MHWPETLVKCDTYHQGEKTMNLEDSEKESDEGFSAGGAVRTQVLRGIGVQ